MSTLFIKCTLEDPTGEIDVKIIDRESFYHEGKHYSINTNLGNVAPQLSMKVNKSLHHKLSDEIYITLGNSKESKLGYIPDSYVKYLMPFYNHCEKKKEDINEYLAVELFKIDPSIDGVGGISIVISINEKVSVVHP